MANIIQAFPKGSGGGGGHTILDSSGTAVAQESNLQFTGLSVTDDSANGKTEVAGEGLNAESINDIAEANSTVPAVIIGDANNYSTTEKVVGQWIDGKPLYQKTFIDSTTHSSTFVISSAINTNDVFVHSIDGMFVDTDGQKPFPLDVTYNGIRYAVKILINASGLNIQIENDSVTYTSVTVQYTKTTDA